MHSSPGIYLLRYRCERSWSRRSDHQENRLRAKPRLADFDLKTPLEKATQLPVELENAANSCALSEICFGRRAEGLRNLVVVTVSEGIGCGLILNHQLVQGSTGTAGEFGHAALIQDGLECSCGNRGVGDVCLQLGRCPLLLASQFH